jgi:hypothetical protein
MSGVELPVLELDSDLVGGLYDLGGVMTFPSAEIRTPEPSPGVDTRPADGSGASPRSTVRTTTTHGLTLWNSSRSCCASVGLQAVQRDRAP